MHYIVGYGSLLSDESRRQFSDIHCQAVPVTVAGWQRAWITRSASECQTYVGAVADQNARLNGALVPIDDITPDLQKREQDYTFEPVSIARLEHPHWTADELSNHIGPDKIWLCQSRKREPADSAHPVYQSYLDTCLLGCMEAGGEAFAELFLTTTDLLHCFWVNDRTHPRYPRAARPSKATAAHIDTLLERCELLEHRRSLVA